MSKTTKLTVKTDVGTFTRRTARTYSHLVVVGPDRAEVLEADRLGALASACNRITRLTADLATGSADAVARQRQHHIDIARIWGKGPAEAEPVDVAKVQADQREDLTDCETLVAKLHADGAVTQDQGAWGILGWCGRLDLAQRLATNNNFNSFQNAGRYRAARVYDVATGDLVREYVHPVVAPETIAKQIQADQRSRRRR